MSLARPKARQPGLDHGLAIPSARPTFCTARLALMARAPVSWPMTLLCLLQHTALLLLVLHRPLLLQHPCISQPLAPLVLCELKVLWTSVFLWCWTAGGESTRRQSLSVCCVSTEEACTRS